MPALANVVDTTSDDIGLKCSVAKGLRQQMHEAVVEATRQVFETEILPAAKAGSPVLSGKNRDSIAVSFRDRLESSWASAWLYTQSGYGWLIERGTSHNRELTRKKKKLRQGKEAVSDRTPAHPYIYPAIVRFVQQIPVRAKEILEQSSRS